MPSDMKSSLHRFRVESRPSPSLHSDPLMSDRRPSAGGVEKSYDLLTAKANHIPACERCRNFKKKCSRTFPVCSLCASAGTKCSFSTPTSSADAQTHHLRARLNWLTANVNQALPAGAPRIDTIETGVDLTELLRCIPARTAASQEQSPAAVITGARDLHLTGDQQLVDQPMTDPGSGHLSINGQVTNSPGCRDNVFEPAETLNNTPRTIIDGEHVIRQKLPPNAAARRFVDAYLRNVNRAYPFVDRNKVLRDLETLGDCPTRQQDASSTSLYLIMAIGCTTLQRAGQIPDDTVSKFDVVYSDISLHNTVGHNILRRLVLFSQGREPFPLANTRMVADGVKLVQENICQEGVESIQILVLLALYSLFDPSGPSAWSLVGMAARQAVLLGLTRRQSETRSLSATDIELRHRLIWSIYVLDRMMATSLGLPAALVDESMNVPLPGLTIDEFASSDRSQFATILQTSRHVIVLRQIEGRILDRVHLLKQSKISTLALADRRAILQDIRTDIENWYSNGCLVCPPEPDNIPIHNSITWLSARYYYLLLLLYYPSQFTSAVVSKAELLRFAQKHVHSTSVLFQQRQLPLNRVTLFRIFPTALVLMHGYVACAADCTPFPAQDDVAVLIKILEAFSGGWLVAHRASHILRQFLNVIMSSPEYTTIQFSIASFTELMQEALGKATCYASTEIVEDRTSRRLGSYGSLSDTGRTGLGSATSMSGLVGSDESDMNYEWPGSLDLDFL
ncbi:fungal-specific transcription factor domain-containing protein [Truncatella angustata]|uniref:Fungal-specific transcription factor domain-containing protein n=1 Tax=Truncatella angustata TaxID=152316 RepID=A0A9P8UBK3_9PEZI|nr:fungal-specific transcription factor domain-containing protein [Truncatella angustata]KAH6640072.1 fungal-specific transcription factor domain-containing protein [Truncatella angustata]